MYNLSISCTKIAILLQYLRVFGPVKIFRICCWTLLSVVVVYSCYTFFTAVFACTPISAFWNTTMEGGRCLPRFPIWLEHPQLLTLQPSVLILCRQVRERKHQHRHRSGNLSTTNPSPEKPRITKTHETSTHHSLPPGRLHMHRLDPPFAVSLRYLTSLRRLLAESDGGHMVQFGNKHCDNVFLLADLEMYLPQHLQEQDLGCEILE